MAVLVFFVGLAVLVGWSLEISILRSMIPGLPAMLPIAAVNLILLSVSMMFSTGYLSSGRSRAPRFPMGMACVLALVVLCFSGYVIVGYFLGFSGGVEVLLFPDRFVYDEGVSFPGNMSLLAAFLCLLTSFALLGRPFRNNHRYDSIFQGIPMVVIGLSLLALIGYIHGITWTGTVRLVGLSVPTAVAFILLACGTMGFEPDTGFMKHWRSKGSDGFFLRWSTAFGILTPILVTTAIAWGERYQLYPPALSDALFAVFTIAVLFFLGLFIASSIRNLEDRRIAREQREARRALQESEESLQEAKERLEIALEASRMGTWEVDLSRNFVHWSEVGEKIFGMSSRERTFSDFWRLVHEADKHRLIEAHRTALKDGADIDLDFRIRRSDETIRWLRSKGRVKFGKRGGIARLSGTVMDVTEERNYQEALENALQAAESASRLKTTFLANMSHEIRTPLGAILGFTDLLADPEASPDDKKRFLEIISRNGKTLSHLINDILDLSKVEAGHLNVEILEFRLHEVIGEVVGLLEKDAHDAGIYLEVEYGNDVPTVMRSDPLRLKQILTNLIGNAIKFTSTGGVTLKISTSGALVVFEIHDTGIGIDEEQRQKLFQPFSQADDSTTRRFGGTGLGLVLSRRLAALLGGSVELKSSEKGKGSVFAVSILNAPSAKTGVVLPALVPEAKNQRLKGVSVLLADDTADSRKLISLLLKSDGAAVDEAKDGQECVDKATRGHYDIILMDIQMPVLDGYSATVQLRKAGFKIPIVALTAHAMADVREKCLSLGCNGHLSKPVDRAQLTKTIYEFTRRPQPERSLM